ncbi:2Fe-2S iron-sulfur cluster-binding protein [Colwellia sp. MEBiC06753]
MNKLKKIHKWLSLLVGIQLLIWLLSGFYFNLMDHRKAAGHQYRAHHQQAPLNSAQLLEPASILAKADAATSISLIQLLGEPYYLLNHEHGLYRHFRNRYSLYHAYSGERLTIDKNLASQLAMQSYNGPGTIDSATLINGAIDDFPKQKNASWQINFSDDVNTSVYIEAGSGRLVGHSDDDKRLADIFFMLHFMDYTNVGSFNNIPMMLSALLVLGLSITGIIWTVNLAINGQYKLPWFTKKSKVKLFDNHQQSLGEVSLSTANNLLHELAEHHVVLPSSCGGGGTCGQCQVLISPNTRITSADAQQFSQEQLAEGYRLACQHFASDVDHMTLIDVSDAKKHTLKLVANRFISPDIKELTFTVLGDNVSYRAGAFMRFLIHAGQGQARPKDLPVEFQARWQQTPDQSYAFDACSRSYSIANTGDGHTLVFTIKMQQAPTQEKDSKYLPGIGSNYLGNLAIGQAIEALGPFQDFAITPQHKLPDANTTLVLIGAGSGIAPLKAIIDEQLVVNNPTKIIFIYGARTEQDLVYQREFKQLAQTNQRFRYLPILSKPTDHWQGATGYAQSLLAEIWPQLPEPSSLAFYLCGPATMMSETIEMLKRRQISEQQIAFDDFS